MRRQIILALSRVTFTLSEIEIKEGPRCATSSVSIWRSERGIVNSEFVGLFPAKPPKTENWNLHGFELHRPSSMGTQLHFQVIKTAGKWWKCDPISEHRLRSSRHGLTWWIGSAPVQMSRCCLGAALSWFAWWAACRVGCSSLTLRFSWTVTLIILGLGFLRARVLRLCCTAGGVLVLRDVGTMKSLHWRCKMWFDCVERKRSAKLPWSATAPCTFAAAPSFQACLRAFIYNFVCVCVYMCMCVCVQTCIYVYICMCVCICTSICLYTCVCVCVCMFVHRLWVLVSVLQRVDGVMHAHVFSCAYVCVCICV